LRSNRLFLASVAAAGLPTEKCKGCHDTEQLYRDEWERTNFEERNQAVRDLAEVFEDRKPL
jgi:hypothetical protein